MSFRLYFVRENFAQLTGGEVRKYFKGRPNMSSRQEGTALKVTYRNPATLARCVFTFNSSGLPRPSNRPGEAYSHLQLGCEIDYLRPSHLAYEALAEAERLAGSMMLSILNPQSQKYPDMPGHPTAREMLSDWQARNRVAIEARAKKEGPMPYLGPQQSTALWRFLLARAALRERLPEEVALPEVEVLSPSDQSPTFTAIRWSGCAPSAFPPAEMVFIERVIRKGIFGIGRKEERGMAKYADVLEAMGGFLDKVALEKPKYSVPALMPERAEAAAKALRAIPLEPLPGELRSVPIDGFVDIRSRPAGKKPKPQPSDISE